MNTRTIFPFLLALILVAFPGCNLIGDIFQAGLWTGLILVVIVVVIIVAIISRIRRRF